MIDPKDYPNLQAAAAGLLEAALLGQAADELEVIVDTASLARLTTMHERWKPLVIELLGDDANIGPNECYHWDMREAAHVLRDAAIETAKGE